MRGSVDRRAFMRSGVLGAAGLGIVSTTGLGREADKTSLSRSGETHEFSAAFDVAPGLLSRHSGSEIQPTPWGFPFEAEAAMPLLTKPFVPDAGDVERWGSALAEGGKAASGLTGRVLDAVVKFPAIGATLPPEVTLAAMDVMLGKSDSLFAIDFFPQATANSAVTIYSDGLPLVGAPVERRIRAEASQDPFIITDFQGWRLQYRPPHVHTLGSCVSAPVNHIHLEVTHQQRYNPARYDTLMSLHIGIYRNPNGQRCLVVWNNYWPTICWRPCMPTWNDLYSAVAWALTASAAIAGVYVAGWVVAAIASAGASVLYVPVLIAL